MKHPIVESITNNPRFRDIVEHASFNKGFRMDTVPIETYRKVATSMLTLADTISIKYEQHPEDDIIPTLTMSMECHGVAGVELHIPPQLRITVAYIVEEALNNASFANGSDSYSAVIMNQLYAPHTERSGSFAEAVLEYEAFEIHIGPCNVSGRVGSVIEDQNNIAGFDANPNTLQFKEL